MHKADSPEFFNFMRNFKVLHSKILSEKPYFLIFTDDFNAHSVQWCPDGDNNNEGTQQWCPDGDNNNEGTQQWCPDGDNNNEGTQQWCPVGDNNNEGTQLNILFSEIGSLNLLIFVNIVAPPALT